MRHSVIIELLWFVIIAVDAYRNHIIIKEGNRPNYLQSFIFRGMAAIIHAIWIDGLFRIFYPLRLFYDAPLGLFTTELFRVWGPVLLFQLFSFAFLFNIILNSLRNKDLDYIGDHSGWIESFLSKFKGKFNVERAYFIFLLVGFILSWVFFRKSL